MTHPSVSPVAGRLGRRGFLALSATVAAGGLVPALATQASARQSGHVLPGSVGYRENDADPRSSSLMSFGQPLRLAIDYNYRSVGVDLGSAQAFQAVELVPESAAHRLNDRDLTLLVSDDNATWTRVSGAETVYLAGRAWVYGFDVTARYVKVHCHRGENAGFTFTLSDLQQTVRVHQLPLQSFVGGGGGAWTFRTMVTVSNPHAQELRDRAVHVRFDELDVDGLVAAGQLQADLRDLRFADAAGRELHAYADGDGVHVRIPFLDAGRTVPIFAYSGNPQAVSRVASDTGALQVEYGRRNLVPQTSTLPDGTLWGGAIKVVQLPDGTLMAAASARLNVGIHARFSRDGGRTWSAPEQILPPTLADLPVEGPGGFIMDEETGILTFFLIVAKVINHGQDYLDPAENNVEQWVAQAHSYTSTGRPVFGPARRIEQTIQDLQITANWALTYANGIVTSDGAYLISVPYICRSDGTFAGNVLRSTDRGQTWQQSTELRLPEVGFEYGITEAAITELADGRIYFITRAQAPRRFYFAESYSSDGGATWSPVVDSTILATNTAPGMSRDANGGLVLAWSGHNGYGQQGYFRNNYTAAYSDDEAQTWHGYQDLLGATSLSVPGWANIAQVRTAVNADMWVSGENDRVFAWSSHSAGFNSTNTYSLRVEDFDDFVRLSHGALDRFAYRRAAGATGGTELAEHRWWRTTRTGSLDLVTGQRAGRHAVRLRSTGNSLPAGASRLFPGVRQGRIRFALRWTTLGAGLHLCLQEAFSGHHNARGTVLSLKLTPSGELLTTTDDIFGVAPGVGYRTGDTNPATGNLTSIGLSQTIGVDYLNRSPGVDMFEVTDVTSLQLIDNDLIGSAGNRMDPAVLKLWRSNTNQDDWAEVTSWAATKNGPVITFAGPALQARYLKVSHPYADTAFTFANDQANLVRVFPDRSDPQTFAPLDTPTTLTAGTWHTVQIDVDVPGDSVVVSVDGTERARLPRLHVAEVVTHLMLLTGATSQPTEVALDELIVQDTSLGLPVTVRSGRTTRLRATSR